MFFSLEVLQAKKGDCLILHFGKKNHPQIIVIDGGPGGVYKEFLRPRLMEIKSELSPDDPLPISLVMVSHMDDDHVNGILKLTGSVKSDIEDNESPDFELDNIWFNSFDDIIGNLEVPAIANIGAAATPANLARIAPELANADHHISAVIASTGQGRRLKDDAETLNLTINNPFENMDNGSGNLVRGDVENGVVEWDQRLKITVLHPDGERLVEMQEKWDKDLKKAKAKGDNSIIYAAMAKRDSSPFNLASIVCYVKYRGKTILLTGDARDDDILDGLEHHKLLNRKGKIHVNILKIPHHGSDRNASREFFEKVTADHYIISGDGSHHNPDKSMLVMLAEGTKGHDNFTIHFTNHDGKFDLKIKLDAFIKTSKKDGRKFNVNFRKEDSDSIILDLLDPVNY